MRHRSNRAIQIKAMLPLLATSALLAALVVSPASLAAPAANLADIENEVMCPICGTALHLSNSPQAERERAFIRRRIDAGKSKDEIKRELVDEYGPEVLALPGTSGFDLAAWLVPGVGIILAGAAIALGARRWRRATRLSPEPTDTAPLSQPDAARLDADLARYEP